MKLKNLLLIFILLLLLVQVLPVTGLQASNAENRTITDMVGRSIEIPTQINHVLSTAPPTTMTIYMLAPDTLLGLNSASNTTKFMDQKYRDLPNVGGWYGTSTGNYETFISLKPDVVIEPDLGTGDLSKTILERQEKFSEIPVIGIMDARNITGYDPSIQFLGSLLNKESESKSLLEFYHRVLSLVQNKASSIPDDKKVTVYYAEGPKGLKTDPVGSSHSELIELVGGKNIADCNITPGMGMTEVSMEQVLSWNPDVIIVGDPGFYKSVYSDPIWANIKAVQNKRVYLVPQAPFPWFDRPPGVNRIIGIPWVAKILYPDVYSDIDITSLAKEFYSKFYHYDLSDSDLTSILNP
ncbi:ABC transporter substrate-binding protein [Methanospirillum lacunae]|uniref:Iron ABC transporter substrate-binding protein n=1 Tax=Methanospirillum lacunae TaxID=668570 RepID=A0A2V2N0U4_9EURY|nr:ABC transporter substrate-binding protein [Methanospirillum lacunae]PWR71266.1 iron ABC transporter substrate-binding protein [Methanospirillum lacunae]